MVDIGASGRNSDGGVFSNSELGYAITNNTLDFPPPEGIGQSNVILPYVFVADEAFPLRPNMMKPFPREIPGLTQRVFNYRLSRARRVVENAFGILASRFRVFRRPVIARVELVDMAVKAAVVLRNFSMDGKEFVSRNQYCSVEMLD